MRGVPNSKRLSVSGKALSKQFDCSITIHNSSSKEIGVAFRFLALIIDNRDATPMSCCNGVKRVLELLKMMDEKPRAMG
jgi:hypothetical protein